MKKRSMKRVISFEMLRERISELIHAGALLKGIDRLLETLNRDFFSHSSKKISKAELMKRLPQCIWGGEDLKLLEKYVKLGLDLQEVYRVLSYLPKDIIDKKAKELRGKSIDKKALTSEPGIGRLLTTSDINAIPAVKVPEASFENPFPIRVRDREHFNIIIMNAPHIGLQYNRMMNENVLRNTFLYAEAVHASAVVIPCALIWLDTKKSEGELTTHRARLSGKDFAPEFLEPSYQEKAKRIRVELPPDEVVYENLRESFANFLGGYKKITHQDNGKPVFSGKIFLTFGLPEEAFIEAAAHSHVRYITVIQRSRIMKERKGLEAQLERESAKEKPDEERISELTATIEGLLKEEQRMVQTNVSPIDRKRIFDKLQSFVIDSYTKAISNCTFIAEGTAYCGIDGKVVEIYQSREDRPTNLLDQYLREKAGTKVLRRMLPDIVLLAGGYNVNARWAVAEKGNDLRHRASAHIIQLPVGIDKKYLDKKLNDVIRKGSPIERLLKDKEFEPGIFHLKFTNGVWVMDFMPIDAVVNYQKRKKHSHKNESKYIYIYLDSDTHYGHPWKTVYLDPKTGKFLPHDVAVKEMLKRSYGNEFPFHSYCDLGDDATAHNFPTEAQPHPLSDSYSVIERQFNRLCEIAKDTRNSREALKQAEELRDKALQQIRFRGEHWVQSQIREVYDRELSPYGPFFLSILKRARKGGVRFIGVDELLHGKVGSRDIGAINFLGGNHFGNTIENLLTEGFFYADKVIDLLMNQRRSGFSKEELRRLVRAPLHGNTSVGYGLVAARGGYEWGISLRHDPSRKSGSNGDPLRSASVNILERGDFSHIFSGRKTIHLSGDIHRYGFVQMTDAVIVSCASGTESDPYGERGFSPNNTGNLILGIPVHGPDHGPVRLIPITHDFVERWFLEPWDIEWNEIFRDAL